MYNKPLPETEHLLTLAKDSHFPATRGEIEANAETWGYLRPMTDFLDLFPADEVFENRTDFVTRCEELEMFIEQERESPKEVTRSPQD